MGFFGDGVVVLREATPEQDRMGIDSFILLWDGHETSEITIQEKLCKKEHRTMLLETHHEYEEDVIRDGWYKTLNPEVTEWLVWEYTDTWRVYCMRVSELQLLEPIERFPKNQGVDNVDREGRRYKTYGRKIPWNVVKKLMPSTQEIQLAKRR